MKLLFVSNDLTHHLVPIFKSISHYYQKENCIFAVMKPSPNRTKMGFPEYTEQWIFLTYEHTAEEYLTLWEEADIIITRVWDRIDLICDALKKGKQVFYASERWYRPPVGFFRLLLPDYAKRLLQFRKLSKYPNFNYLAMGYYAGLDFKKVGLCKKRIFNFGYFTPSVHEPQTLENREQVKLIWVGNMLKLKRVIDLLHVYHDLEKNYNLSLTLVGQGHERTNLENYVNKNRLRNVSFYNFLPNSEVKKMMQDADIYVFPSSGYEGWGAVVNEAMQTKCAVVAAVETGAARSLIIHGKNGMLFQTGNRNQLKKNLIKILDDRLFMETLKEEGYKTINEIWSAEEAGRRFAKIVERLQHNESADLYLNGPMAILG